MPDEAALDAGLDLAEGVEVEESTVAEESPAEGTEQIAAEPDAGTAPGEPPTSKTLYQRAMALDPELAKGLRKPLFELDRWNKEVPGGLAEVRQLRQAVEELGGEDGIKQVQKTLEGWENFDQKYMAGDPEVIEFMLKGFPDDPASAEAAQSAFLKLAPSIFAKYAEMDSEGYTAYVMQQVHADAHQADIPLALARLQDFIGDHAGAKPLFDQIKAYFARIDAWAKRPVTTKVGTRNDPAQGNALDQRKKDLDAREATATRNEWNSAAFEQMKPIYEAEFAKLLGNRTISDKQRTALAKLFNVEYKEARKEALEKAQQYVKRNDRAGFLKFTVNSAKDLIPRVMREVFDSLLPGKPGPAPGQRQAAARAGAPAIPEPGFTRVPRQPHSEWFDWSHPFNSPTNIQAGKGIGKDGKKVKWPK